MRRVDLLKEPLDELNNVYFCCECPHPLNIVWAIERPEEDGAFNTVCPECGTKIGVVYKGRKHYKSRLG